MIFGNGPNLMDTYLLYQPDTGNIIRKKTTSGRCLAGDIAGSVRSDGYRGMSYYLGSFDSMEEASAAYTGAKACLHI